MRPPGIEPGLEAWEATIITVRSQPHEIKRKYHNCPDKYLIALLPINPYAFAAGLIKSLSIYITALNTKSDINIAVRLIHYDRKKTCSREG